MYNLSDLASQDIDSIIDYTVVNFGADVMIKYHQSLAKCFQTLSENPDIGLQSDYIINNYYRFNHQAHVIYYKKINADILIIRVLHKSMDVTKHI